MRIYISGVKDLTGLEKAVRWGASAVGIRIGYGEKAVHPEKARELFFELPLFLSRVGIFSNQKRYEIEELVTFCRLDTLHFTGCEQPAELERYGEQLIKTFTRDDLGETRCYPVQAVCLPVGNETLEEPIDLPADKKLILAGELPSNGWQRVCEMYSPYAAQIEIEKATPELIRSLLVL